NQLMIRNATAIEHCTQLFRNVHWWCCEKLIDFSIECGQLIPTDLGQRATVSATLVREKLRTVTLSVSIDSAPRRNVVPASSLLAAALSTLYTCDTQLLGT